MIKTTAMLIDELPYANPKTKVARMVANGELFPIVRGLYETDGDLPGHLLAGCIYGPSYLSFEFALAYYNIIPERVHVYTSATFGKRRTKRFDTSFGTFTYHDVQKRAYPLFVDLRIENKRGWQIALPEKALCDMVSIMSPIDDVEALLFDDLRCDQDALDRMDVTKLAVLRDAFRSRNVSMLVDYFEGEKHGR